LISRFGVAKQRGRGRLWLGWAPGEAEGVRVSASGRLCESAAGRGDEGRLRWWVEVRRGFFEGRDCGQGVRVRGVRAWFG